MMFDSYKSCHIFLFMCSCYNVFYLCCLCLLGVFVFFVLYCGIFYLFTMIDIIFSDTFPPCLLFFCSVCFYYSLYIILLIRLISCGLILLFIAFLFCPTIFFFIILRLPCVTLLPYPPLFRSVLL